MPPKRWFITCEICGYRTHRKSNDEKRDFMAQFPLDEDRCRQWVKIVGKEDLAYVPIEKLHRTKNVCGKHFERKAFNKKRNRLSRKFAVPTINLTRDPLPDELLIDFPCRISSDRIDRSILPQSEMLVEEHNYSISEIKEILALQKTLKSGSRESSSIKEQTDINVDDDYTFDEDVQADNSDNIDTEPEPAPPVFSWQRANNLIDLDEPNTDTEIVPRDLYEDVNVNNASTVLEGEATEDTTEGTADTDYTCNECRQNIFGFRYTCVQCDDYDLCGACEATLIHPQHYMLRVPGPRPQGEVKMMLDAIRKTLENLGTHANNITHENCDLVIKKEKPFEELPTESGASQKYAGFEYISDHSQVPNISHSTYSQQKNRSFESKLSDNSEFVANNGNQKQVSEQEKYDSRSDDWLNESFLEINDDSSADGNEVITKRLRSNYDVTLKVPVVGKNIGESLVLKPNAKRKNNDAPKKVSVIKIDDKKILKSKNEKRGPTFLQLYTESKATKVLPSAVKSKNEVFVNNVKQSNGPSKGGIAVFKTIGKTSHCFAYTRTLEPIDSKKLTTKSARLICSLKKPIVKLEDISKTLLAK